MSDVEFEDGEGDVAVNPTDSKRVFINHVDTYNGKNIGAVSFWIPSILPNGKKIRGEQNVRFFCQRNFSFLEPMICNLSTIFFDLLKRFFIEIEVLSLVKKGMHYESSNNNKKVICINKYIYIENTLRSYKIHTRYGLNIKYYFMELGRKYQYLKDPCWFKNFWNII